MKPVTENHTVIQGVTTVTDNNSRTTSARKTVPQPVQRRAQRQTQGGCKSCGQRR